MELRRKLLDTLLDVSALCKSRATCRNNALDGVECPFYDLCKNYYLFGGEIPEESYDTLREIIRDENKK